LNVEYRSVIFTESPKNKKTSVFSFEVLSPPAGEAGVKC